MPSTELLTDVESEDSCGPCLQSGEGEKEFVNEQNNEKPGETAADSKKNDITDLLENMPKLNRIFTIIDKIGSGTFSSVYLARLKNQSIEMMFALKHIIPTSHPSRIENELKCLLDIGGQDNIIEAKACFRERDHVVIVMPYIAHNRFQDYVDLLTIDEIQLYVRSLLTALRRVHSIDLIHRDVKPSNFLFNRTNRQFALVDFGLAQRAPVPLMTNANNGSKPPESPDNPCKAELSLKSEKSPPFASKSVDCVKESPRKRKLDSLENDIRGKQKILKLDGDPDTKIEANLEKIPSGTPSADGNRKLQMLDQNRLSQPVFTTTSAVFKSIYGKMAKSPRRALLTKRAFDTHKSLEIPKQKLNYVEGGQKHSGHVDGGAGRQSSAVEQCDCFGQPSVCNICLFRAIQQAPRAGTPGFRAPEVLMKFPDQTTAVDIWSVGVIFLSLLSGRYPFFKAVDDLTSLAQIVSVFGYEKVKTAAASYGRHLLVSPEPSGFDLKVLCEKLRTANQSSPNKDVSVKSPKKATFCDAVPDSAYDLLNRLLDLNPFTRITAEEALKHPFFLEVLHNKSEVKASSSSL